MSTELLPCPFCGSTNLRYEFAGSQGYIQCNECGTEGPCDERAADPICDIDAACAAWNRRAALAEPEPEGLTFLSASLNDDGTVSLMMQRSTSQPSAEPAPEVPTDEEIIAFWADHCAGDGDAGIIRLARWGRPAPEPAKCPACEGQPAPSNSPCAVCGAAAPQPTDVHYEWDLEDADGEWQAGGSANSLDDVKREGMRYLQNYAQEGAHKLIIRQHRTKTIEEITNG